MKENPDPVAIIGIGCRFAGGANTPDSFWELLRSGRDGIGVLPADRWREYAERASDHAAAVRRASVHGGFLPDVAGFDAAFFGLSPREAALMDPQQRLLLELTWEALEHAGIPPRELAGTPTGVFVGVGSDDYGRRMLEDLPSIEAWTGIGSAMCAVANRVSYALDLRGPSLAVDTACSASLVAAHLACQSLRQQESRIALLGGVNLIISPGLTLTLDAAGATAPDGRCKPFDAAADGYGRGEGGGVLVLKRLADAQRDGDRVLAVILGSAVRQDGRTNGIMAPSGPAQQAVLAEACRRADVLPHAVDYVEAHGTGTRLGDPVEAGALSAVYGTGRAAGTSCLIGSVKPNIGHLEAGAGVASLIKVTLALAAGEIPASLNFTTGNPAIDWTSNGLRVVTERTRWRRGERPRRAGVSGFGYGGTIGHVVVGEAPRQPAVDIPPDGADRLFPLSAGSENALRKYARTLADWLAEQPADVPLASIGHTLALRRSHLPHRAAIVAADREDLRAGLCLTADGKKAPALATGVPAGAGRGVVWVFSGHGAQWKGMGRELLDTEPAFARAVEELAPVIQAELGFAPQQVLREGDLATVDRIQTMTFVMQVGLAAVWGAYGVHPDAVIGHSVGEVAAAVAAGALTPCDGARLICRRSRLLREVAGQGAMAMVNLPFDEVDQRLAGRVDAAAAISASPVSTVISGSPEAVDSIIEEWDSTDVVLRRVASDVAFHSPQMDPLCSRLEAAAADISPEPPRIPMYRTALADPRAEIPVDGTYWAANLRNPVRLAAATQAAAADGYRAFIEISAHPVVAHSIGETLSDCGLDDVFVGVTGRRDRSERASFLVAVGAAHCHGIPVDWRALQPGGELVTLPPVAWQRQPYWHPTTPTEPGGWNAHDAETHTLLGAPIPVAGRGLRLWRTVLDESTTPYPGSHAVNGVEIVPAAVLISTFLVAAGDTLSDVSLRLPLVAGERREVQVGYDEGGLWLASRDPGEHGAWLTHTTASAGSNAAADPPIDAAAPTRPADPGAVARHLASVGVPSMAFNWTVEQLHRGVGALRAAVTVEDTTTWAPVLDAALSIAPIGLPESTTLRMVAEVERVRVSGRPPAAAEVWVTVDAGSDDTVHVVVADAGGATRAALTGLRYAPVGSAGAQPQELVHEVEWRRLELSPGPASRDLVVLGGSPELVEAIRARVPACRAELGEITETTDILVLPSTLDGLSVPDAAARAAWRMLEVAGQLDQGRLWGVTVGVRESKDAAHLAQATLWGLGRVLATEQDEVCGGVIDLPASDPVGAVDTLLAIVRSTPVDKLIAVRYGEPYAARLRQTGRASRHDAVTCRPDSTYLITGGLGQLGLQVARWLADRGARRLVLAGRRQVPPRADWAAGVRALEARGVTVRPLSLDIADADAARTRLHSEALGLPPIRGIVHAAGVLDNRLARNVDEASLRAVLRPKVDGAWALHHAFPPGSLDFFVLFSSCGQLLGLPGQATYGAANSFLDALAAHRTDTMSLGWTSWRGQGMAVNDAVDRELRARGVTDISPAEAFEAWDFAARRGPGHYAVLGVRAAGAEPLPILHEVATLDTVPREAAADSVVELAPDELLAEVGAQIAGEMRLSVAELDFRRSLVEQGLDSIMTIVVRRKLEKRFGHKLPSKLFWQQPTVAAITEHLAQRISSSRPADPAGGQ